MKRIASINRTLQGETPNTCIGIERLQYSVRGIWVLSTFDQNSRMLWSPMSLLSSIQNGIPSPIVLFITNDYKIMKLEHATLW